MKIILELEIADDEVGSETLRQLGEWIDTDQAFLAIKAKLTSSNKYGIKYSRAAEGDYLIKNGFEDNNGKLTGMAARVATPMYDFDGNMVNVVYDPAMNQYFIYNSEGSLLRVESNPYNLAGSVSSAFYSPGANVVSYGGGGSSSGGAGGRSYVTASPMSFTQDGKVYTINSDGSMVSLS